MDYKNKKKPVQIYFSLSDILKIYGLNLMQIFKKVFALEKYRNKPS